MSRTARIVSAVSGWAWQETDRPPPHVDDASARASHGHDATDGVAPGRPTMKRRPSVRRMNAAEPGAQSVDGGRSIGHMAMVACASCAHPVPSGARFCPSCGHPVAGATVALEERRVVTVLFADLVGYTTLAERRDPENVKRLIESCFERLVPDIELFGGRVDKLLGDGIVALFGAPVAHEDDAERAVRAGLRMQETLCAFVEDAGIVATDRDARRHQHRRGARRHAGRLRLHGDGRRRQHRLAAAVVGSAGRRAGRLGHGGPVLRGHRA